MLLPSFRRNNASWWPSYNEIHCVKSVQIRSCFCSVFSWIRTDNRKVRTRNNSVFGHFSRSDSFQELYFFWYFFTTLNIFCLIWNCLWSILRWSYWDLCNFISHFITNQITSSFNCFWIALFQAVVFAFAADCSAWSRSFWRAWSEIFATQANIPRLHLLLTLLSKFLLIFLANNKNP